MAKKKLYATLGWGVSIQFGGLIFRKIENLDALMREAEEDAHVAYGFKVAFAVKSWGAHVENEQLHAWLRQVGFEDKNAMVARSGGCGFSGSLLAMGMRPANHVAGMGRERRGRFAFLHTEIPNILPDSATGLCSSLASEEGPVCIGDIGDLGLSFRRGAHFGGYGIQILIPRGHAVGILTYSGCRLFTIA